MTTFWVYYPRGLKTGGPLALHQLVDSMRRQGLDAHLVPVPGTENAPAVPEYAELNCPVHEGAIPDRADSVIITPEPEMSLLASFQSARTVVWWLSVDNAETEWFRSQWRRRDYSRREVMKLWLRHQKRVRRPFSRVPGKVIKSSSHIAQSAFAAHHVSHKHGLPTAPVTDYINATPHALTEPRVDGRVAYNPAKGQRYLKELIAETPDIDWLPINGLTPTEVMEALATSQVYLDLGHHPGKDRIPREAALAGCAVIVLARGSAAFHEDVPIADEFKVSPVGDVVANAARALRSVLQAPERAAATQSEYRDWILGEPDRFDAEVQDFCRTMASD